MAYEALIEKFLKQTRESGVSPEDLRVFAEEVAAEAQKPAGDEKPAEKGQGAKSK